MTQVFDVSVSQLRSWCNPVSDGMRPNNRFMTIYEALANRDFYYYGCYLVVEMATSNDDPDYYDFGCVWCNADLEHARVLVNSWDGIGRVLHPHGSVHYEIWHIIDDMTYAERYDFSRLFDLDMSDASGYPQPSQYFGTIDDVVVHVAIALGDYAPEYNVYSIARQISEYDERCGMFRLLPDYDDRRYDFTDDAFWRVVAANEVVNEVIPF